MSDLQTHITDQTIQRWKYTVCSSLTPTATLADRANFSTKRRTTHSHPDCALTPSGRRTGGAVDVLIVVPSTSSLHCSRPTRNETSVHHDGRTDFVVQRSPLFVVSTPTACRAVQANSKTNRRVGGTAVLLNVVRSSFRRRTQSPDCPSASHSLVHRQDSG